MNHLKTNTSGIDCSIKALQEVVYSFLVDAWGEIDMYGRVYRNNEDKSVIPELFVEKGHKDNRYEEVYLNSSDLGKVFFIDSKKDQRVHEGKYVSYVKMVFMLNLKKIFNDGRRDDKAQLDAVRYVEEYGNGDFQIQDIEKTMDTVFAGFDLSKIRFDNMHPFHVFSLNGNMYYELTKKC